MRDIKYINLKDNSVITKEDPRFENIRVVQSNTNIYWLRKDDINAVSEIVFALYDTVYVLADIDDEDDLIVNGYGLHLGDNFEIIEWVWDSYGDADFCYQYLDTSIIEDDEEISMNVDELLQKIKEKIPQENIDKVLEDAGIEIIKYNYLYDMVKYKCEFDTHGCGDKYYLTVKSKLEDSEIDNIFFVLSIYGDLYEDIEFKAEMNYKDGERYTIYIDRDEINVIDMHLYDMGIDLNELIKDYDYRLY